MSVGLYSQMVTRSKGFQGVTYGGAAAGDSQCLIVFKVALPVRDLS